MIQNHYIIKIKDIFLTKLLKFNAIHGLHEHEKTNSQKFEIDIEVSCRSDNCNDDLQKTINYEILYSIAKNIIMNNSFNLIETIGEEIIKKIFKNYPGVYSAKVNVRKPQIKFDNNSNCVEITLVKTNE